MSKQTSRRLVQFRLDVHGGCGKVANKVDIRVTIHGFPPSYYNCHNIYFKSRLLTSVQEISNTKQEKGNER